MRYTTIESPIGDLLLGGDGRGLRHLRMSPFGVKEHWERDDAMFTEVRGQLIPVPTPERALEFLAAEGKPVNGPLPGRRGIVGSPDTVRAGLERIVADYGADEVIVVTITHDHGARRRSYELLAEAMGLERQLTPAGEAAL